MGFWMVCPALERMVLCSRTNSYEQAALEVILAHSGGMLNVILHECKKRERERHHSSCLLSWCTRIVYFFVLFINAIYFALIEMMCPAAGYMMAKGGNLGACVCCVCVVGDDRAKLEYIRNWKA